MDISLEIFISFSSLFISIFAAIVSLIKFSKESKLQRRADLVSAYSDIISLIDNDRTIRSRGLLRKSELLEKLKNTAPEINKKTSSLEVDEKTEEAARYVATTYDRLGFILKSDKELEEAIIGWHGDTIIEMWLLTRRLIINKWRLRNAGYAKEFERLNDRTIRSISQHR